MIPKYVLLHRGTKLCHALGLPSVPFPPDDVFLRSVKPHKRMGTHYTPGSSPTLSPHPVSAPSGLAQTSLPTQIFP